MTANFAVDHLLLLLHTYAVPCLLITSHIVYPECFSIHSCSDFRCSKIYGFDKESLNEWALKLMGLGYRYKIYY
jgi:hypothetical protein